MNRYILSALAFSATLSLSSNLLASTQYDLVIHDGRVINPENKLDGIRDVGIKNGKIVYVGKKRATGTEEINAYGLVVAPGFIDLHHHAPYVASHWMSAYDGVTTALELELGSLPVPDAYNLAADRKLPLNYGFSSAWGLARMNVMANIPINGDTEVAFTNFAKPGWGNEATPEQKARILDLVRQGVRDGGIGIGIPLGYAPNSGRDEYLDVARLAARQKVPTFTHIRSKYAWTPDGKDTADEGVREVLDVARKSGAHMHICHINSSLLSTIKELGPVIKLAQKKAKRGTITTEAYPWGAGSTAIGAAFLAPDKLQYVNAEASDIYWVPEDRRVKDAQELTQIRTPKTQGGLGRGGDICVVHYLDEEDPADRAVLDEAVLFPDAAIATDAMPYQEGPKKITDATWPLPDLAYSHPRSAASYTRMLGEYARDKQQIPLMEVIRRSSLLPAQIIEKAAPMAKRKGRIKVGADADLAIFDPLTVNGRATYSITDGNRNPSVGMHYVIVNGQFVIKDGLLLRDIRPGKPLRGPIRSVKRRSGM